MSERNPSQGYLDQHFGEFPGLYEVGVRRYVLNPERQTVVDVVYDLELSTSGTATVEISKPDARVTPELYVGFVPRDLDQTTVLETTVFDGRTVGQRLTDSRIWLSLIEDYGGGVREGEDIIGTKAAPEPLVTLGNWGAIYEVDLDCSGCRAQLSLVTPGVLGRWMCGARWTAREPMSDRDWEHARQNMNLVVQPRKHPGIHVGYSLDE
jgi:hypothetical protein